MRRRHPATSATKPAPATAKAKVREALNLAIDKPTILSQILKGHGELLQGQLLTSATFGFNSYAYP